MFAVALLIGLYSYLIFALGLLGLLQGYIILALSGVFLVSIFLIRKRIFTREKSGKERRKGYSLFAFLILLQAGVNLLGVLGPELSFDALWYHLTLPKLYVEHQAIFYIPGSLLYYSAMPKLIEMLYIPALLVGNEAVAKGIHFTFGLLTAAALFRLGRKFTDSDYALVGAALFYSNLIVGWESITTYIDLGRTFFEFLAFMAFLEWTKTREKKWVIESGILLGLAITAKLLALGSVLIFFALFFFDATAHHITLKKQGKALLLFALCSLIVPLPWLVFSFVHTGNPIFPLFTNTYPIQPVLNIFDLREIVSTFWTLLIQGADPISPLYIIFIPIVFITLRKLNMPFRFMAVYSLFALLVWYITPRTGGGRFYMPYLPVLSLLIVEAYRVSNFSKVLKKVLAFLLILVISTSIAYRAAANAKFIPYILGLESKEQFLTQYLPFSFGNFYDTDSYFARTIKPTDTVLLYGFHNLYYVNFSFIHESWVKKGNTFRFIATQNVSLPDRFRYFNMVYENPVTGVKLYTSGDQKWVY